MPARKKTESDLPAVRRKPAVRKPEAAARRRRAAGPLFIVVYLQSPREKFWGILHGCSPSGIWTSGAGLKNLEEWLDFGFRQGDEAPTLSITFFPMHRVEKITVDQTEGGLPSLHETIRIRTGRMAADLFPENETEAQLPWEGADVG